MKTHLKIVLFIAAVICACSPEKKLNRLLNKHPELKKDTIITVYDTLKIPGFRTDTVIKKYSHYDTITVTKNNVTTKVVVYRDSIFIRNTGTPVIKTKVTAIPVTRIIQQTDDKKRWLYFWGGTCAALFMALIILGAILFKRK